MKIQDFEEKLEMLEAENKDNALKIQDLNKDCQFHICKIGSLRMDLQTSRQEAVRLKEEKSILKETLDDALDSATVLKDKAKESVQVAKDATDMLKKELNHSASLDVKFLRSSRAMKKLLIRLAEAQVEIHIREEKNSYILGSVRHFLEEHAIARLGDLVPEYL